MWARAVGFDDPVFYDEERRARARVSSRSPPRPGFLGRPRIEAGRPRARPADPRAPPGPHAEPERRHRVHVRPAPILAGDALVATTRIVEVKEREGSIGRMLIFTRETTYRRGEETVATLRATVINY